VLQRFREARFDKRPIVVSHAAAAAVGGNGSTGGDELCEMAFDVFMLAYGSEVGATAL